MTCVGGFWFWFSIRVNVSAEGHPWYHVMFADLFVLALLASQSTAFLWSVTQGSGSMLSGLFLLLFIVSNVVYLEEYIGLNLLTCFISLEQQYKNI